MTEYDLTVTAKLKLIKDIIKDMEEAIHNNAYVTQDDVRDMRYLSESLNYHALENDKSKPVYIGFDNNSIALAMHNELMEKGIIHG